jgi:hypothetical protein
MAQVVEHVTGKLKAKIKPQYCSPSLKIKTKKQTKKPRKTNNKNAKS